MKGTKYLISLLVAMALVLGIQTFSHAVATLKLTDGVVTVEVSDGEIGATPDSNPVVGAVTYIGAVGAAWTVNVTTGLTYPSLGSPAEVHIDLNSVDVNTDGASTLNIQFSEIGFTGPLGGGILGIHQIVGGTLSATAGSTVTFKAYVDDGNALFALTSLLTTIGPFGPGAYAGEADGFAAGITAPFSMTSWAQLAFTGPGVASFDSEIHGKIPEPISLILLGCGLAGAGLYRRLRKNR